MRAECVRPSFFSTQRTHFFLLLVPLPFLPEEPVCFRGGVLRDNVSSLFDGITLRALPLTCDVSAGQVPKVLQSLASPRRWRTCEYPIFMACHTLPLSSTGLFDFLRESAVHSSFDFSSMFVFAYIIQLLPYSLSLLSVSFPFFFLSAFLRMKTKNITKTKNYPGIVVDFTR